MTGCSSSQHLFSSHRIKHDKRGVRGSSWIHDRAILLFYIPSLFASWEFLFLFFTCLLPVAPRKIPLHVNTTECFLTFVPLSICTIRNTAQRFLLICKSHFVCIAAKPGGHDSCSVRRAELCLSTQLCHSASMTEFGLLDPEHSN